MISINNINEVNKLRNLHGGEMLRREIENKIIHIYNNLSISNLPIDKFNLDKYIGIIIILKSNEVSIIGDKIKFYYKEKFFESDISWIEEKRFNGFLYYHILILEKYKRFISIYLEAN